MPDFLLLKLLAQLLLCTRGSCSMYLVWGFLKALCNLAFSAAIKLFKNEVSKDEVQLDYLGTYLPTLNSQKELLWYFNVCSNA